MTRKEFNVDEWIANALAKKNNGENDSSASIVNIEDLELHGGDIQKLNILEHDERQGYSLSGCDTEIITKFANYLHRFIEVNDVYPVDALAFDDPIVAYCWFKFQKSGFIQKEIDRLEAKDPNYQKRKAPKEAGFETEKWLKETIIKKNHLDQIIDVPVDPYDPNEVVPEPERKPIITEVNTNLWDSIQNLKL